MRLWRLTAAFAVVLVCGIRLPAQAPAPPVATFSGGVELVQLDVSVIDKKTRLPVTGLTASDFAVTEDGKPRPVAAFSAVNLPDRDMTAAAWTREVGPDVVTN